MTPTDLTQRLQQADMLRKSNHWKEALAQYALAETRMDGIAAAAVKHNIAVCYLGLGNEERAIEYCDAALRLNAGLWQSEVIKAKALKANGENDAALALLSSLLKRHPANPDVRLELAAIALQELGDAAIASKLVEPLGTSTAYESESMLTMLMAGLYDRQQSAEELTKDIMQFAEAHLQIPQPVVDLPAVATVGRTRVGLISSHFCCSPVYFFCIGALRHLANDVDLCFFDRGKKSDWAHRDFKAIARDWFDVAGMDSEALAIFMRKQNLDVLVDLGGWMDPVALRALSTKPAKRMFKWVGGQSATTGLRVFDGMFSDAHQSPLALQALYTEPLILLKSGYVTYAPPPYMPAPASNLLDHLTLGVISNPAKVSNAFLSFLKQRLMTASMETNDPIELRFIDKRYRHGHLKNRINAALDIHGKGLSANIRVSFVTPKDHVTYLGEVARLDTILDTFPYTGGLTTMEALSLGVPCFTRTGRLFSERHTFAHCMYAGMDKKDFDLDTWNPAQSRKIRKEHASLIKSRSKRLNHAGLAKEMARYLDQ